MMACVAHALLITYRQKAKLEFETEKKFLGNPDLLRKENLVQPAVLDDCSDNFFVRDPLKKEDESMDRPA